MDPGPHDTAQRLLEAGRKLFARWGFEGTSVRALTAEAGTNLGAITYHFGTKEALFQAVLEGVFKPVRERLKLLGEMPIPAPERMELFVRGMFQHLKDNPDMPRFMFQEIVLGDHPSPQTLETARTVTGTLSRIMADGQREGTLVDGDPVLMALSVLSQPIYLTLMPAFLTREDLRDADLPTPTESAEAHAVAFLGRALLAQEEEKA